jgi:short-subunit dehydrogenase
LEAVTTALRLELLQSGVQVSLIEPGVIATPFWDKAIKGEEELAKQSRSECLKHYTQELATRHQQLKALKQRGRSPDVVCRAIVHALMAPRPKLRYVVGLDAKLRTVAGRILPEGVRYWLASRRK